LIGFLLRHTSVAAFSQLQTESKWTGDAVQKIEQNPVVETGYGDPASSIVQSRDDLTQSLKWVVNGPAENARM
jgi:hypothetical protein